MSDQQKNTSRQAVTMFREILFLPLRLRRPEDKPRLLRLFENQSWPQGWVDHPGPSLAFQAQSKLWMPSGERMAPNPKSGKEDRQLYELKQAYAEAAYFHPYVQQFLYSRGDDNGAKVGAQSAKPIVTRNLNGIEQLRVRMGYGDNGLVDVAPSARSFEVDLTVERIEMHCIDKPGLVMMVIELAADGNTALRRYDQSTELPGRHTLSIAEVLALKDGLRRVYPPFFTHIGTKADGTLTCEWMTKLFPEDVEFMGGLAPSKTRTAFTADRAFALTNAMVAEVATPFAPWWESLLDPLLKAKGKDGKPLLVQVVDDRMPSLSLVAVPDISNVARSDQIRLCFADAPGVGLPYAKSFLADFERGHCYDRFLDFGTRYMFSSYSLVLLVETNVAPGTDCRSVNFLDTGLDVLQEHLRRHYLRMMMLAQLQRASLLAFSNWVSQAMRDSRTLRDPTYRSKISDLRRAFTEFTQVSWFSNVSNQEQARDIFDLLQRHLGNAALQGEVANELDRAQAVLTEIDEERQADAAVAFNSFAASATVVGLPLAFLALLPDFLDPTKPHLRWIAIGSVGVAAVAAPIAVLLLARLETLGRVWSGTSEDSAVRALTNKSSGRGYLDRTPKGLQVAYTVAILVFLGCVLGELILAYSG